MKRIISVDIIGWLVNATKNNVSTSTIGPFCVLRNQFPDLPFKEFALLPTYIPGNFSSERRQSRWIYCDVVRRIRKLRPCQPIRVIRLCNEAPRALGLRLE